MLIDIIFLIEWRREGVLLRVIGCINLSDFCGVVLTSVVVIVFFLGFFNDGVFVGIKVFFMGNFLLDGFIEFGGFLIDFIRLMLYGGVKNIFGILSRFVIGVLRLRRLLVVFVKLDS